MRTRADGTVMPDVTLSVDATRTRTWVPTLVAKTSLVKGAVGIGQTLRMAGRIVCSTRSPTRVTHYDCGTVHIAG